MTSPRVLIVMEPGRDGVFDCVAALIDHSFRTHPEIGIDLAYSSLRSRPSLAALVARVEARGGATCDLRIGNALQWRDCAAAGQLLRLIRRKRPQVIAAYSSKAGGLCRLLKKGVPGLPPVVYAPYAYFGMSGQKDLRTRFYNAIERFLGGSVLTLNCSLDERDFATRVLHVPPEKTRVIDIGIDLQRFRPASREEKNACRDALGIPRETTVFVSIGRRSFQKQYEPLYHAFEPMLAPPDSRAWFVHAGEGSAELGTLLSEAARRRHQSIRFLPDFERLLFAADAFVLTSRYEGQALAVLGGLACGLKMFLTRVPGNQCLAAMGFDEIGWIEPDPDEATLARRIENVLGGWVADGAPPPSLAQVERSRSFFDETVQLEKIIQTWAQLGIPLQTYGQKI